MWLGVASCQVWDMILQWGSTNKVSIELPATTRHRSDMTEKLLKAMLNPNTHTHFLLAWKASLLKEAALNGPIVSEHYMYFWNMSADSDAKFFNFLFWQPSGFSAWAFHEHLAVFKSCGLHVYEQHCEKTCLMSNANNKAADQPAHLCSLISAFVIHLSILAKCRISKL